MIDQQVLEFKYSKYIEETDNNNYMSTPLERKIKPKQENQTNLEEGTARKKQQQQQANMNKKPSPIKPGPSLNPFATTHLI